MLKRIVAFAAAVVMISATARMQSPRPVTVDDLMALRTINDIEISPPGDRIAYTVSTPSVERNAHEPALFVIGTTGGTPKRLAESQRIFTPSLPAPRLRWSPDGRRVSMLVSGAGGPQVVAVDPVTNAVTPVTSAPAGVSAYEWSPDGKSIAYLSRDTASGPPPVANKVGANPPATRLWLQSIPPSGTPAALTPADQYVDSLAWSPDSREIAYSFAPFVGFLAPYSSKIHAVDAVTRAIRPIIDRAGMNVSPQFSPDGTKLAFITTHERTGIIAPRGLAVADVSGRNAGIRAYPMNGAWIAEMQWAPDNRSLFVTMNEGTFATGAHMFEMPIVRVSLADGTADRLGSGATVEYSMSLSRDGKTLAYREVQARTMGDLVVMDVASKQARRLTDVNPQLEDLALGELKPISWTSFDGMEIWGLLLTPPGYRGTSPIPLLVYCHGGPIGGVTLGIFPQFMHVPGQIDPYPTEAFASAGFAVLFPMPRGGSGYGEAGHKMIINDWGGPDYKDIMAGVDHLIARGIADRDRLGVMGASYGGFMTNWIVTQTPRFKAAAAGASIADLTDLYYLTDGGDLMAEYYRLPWENPGGYARSSPLTHVKNVTTPILISHGDRDPRVPLATAQKFFRALQVLGKTAEMDIYPGGGHVFYPPLQEKTVMTRNFDWMRRWIKAP